MPGKLAIDRFLMPRKSLAPTATLSFLSIQMCSGSISSC